LKLETAGIADKLPSQVLQDQAGRNPVTRLSFLRFLCFLPLIPEKGSNFFILSTKGTVWSTVPFILNGD